jgi:hypothetical protein
MSTPKENERQRQVVEGMKHRLQQLHKQDQAFKRSNRDPEFTTEDIAQIWKMPVRDVNKALREANVGTFALRERDGFGMVRTRVVRWSQLRDLAKDFGWF